MAAAEAVEEKLFTETVMDMNGPIEIQLRRIADAVEATARDTRFLELFFILQKQGERIMASLDALTAEVAKIKTVEDSAIALLQGLSQQIKDAGVDQAKLDALTAQLDADVGNLAAAVTANTPAVPPETAA